MPEQNKETEKEEMKKNVIKLNSLLATYIPQWLSSIKVSGGGKSRRRYKIVNILFEHSKDFNAARKSLLEQYAEKDDKNKLKVDDKNNAILNGKNKKEFEKEWQDMISEEIVFEINEATKNAWQTVYDIIIDYDGELGENKGINTALLHSMLCDALEEAGFK